MFNVGGPEIVVILLVALVILGPDQLPKAMRTFGNVMGEIRKVSGGFQNEMRKAMDTLDTTGSDKPQSPKPPSGQPDATAGTTAATPAEADVTEVVARNPVAGSGAVAADVANAAETPAPARPAIDPADRAAG
ncbi:MAG TPA: twin-arginine translocase TatA/TatE family subunit [Aquihabitans sp.]|nr:twin-arginine translocase TatA/TatE family subunit [Aquihabitans sp.]